MSQTFLRSCCSDEKQYVIHFDDEPSVLCCESHFTDKAFLIGAKKIINLKTKGEVI